MPGSKLWLLLKRERNDDGSYRWIFKPWLSHNSSPPPTKEYSNLYSNTAEESYIGSAIYIGVCTDRYNVVQDIATGTANARAQWVGEANRVVDPTLLKSASAIKESVLALTTKSNAIAARLPQVEVMLRCK
jgi:hypothetical protein